MWERGRDGDVLPDWETEDGGWAWEGEAVDGGVVGEDGLLGELEVLEFLLQDWLVASLCVAVSLLSIYSFAPERIRATKGKDGTGKLTALEDLPSTKDKRNRDGVWDPFGLADGGTNDQETGWDIDAIDKGRRGKLIRSHLVGSFRDVA